MKTLVNLLAAGATATAMLGVAGATAAYAAGPVEHITVYVLRGEMAPKGPDGHGHDMIAPANFVVKAGTKVDLKIINYDEGPHTITSAKMGLNLMIKPGDEISDNNIKPVVTEYTFTPTKKGVFRWHCTVPCDKGGKFWAMSKGYDGPDQDGYMAGYFVVI
jgi:plastocyanin